MVSVWEYSGGVVCSFAFSASLSFSWHRLPVPYHRQKQARSVHISSSSLTGITVSVCGVGDVPGLTHLVGSALTRDFSAASGDFNFTPAWTRLNPINPKSWARFSCCRSESSSTDWWTASPFPPAAADRRTRPLVQQQRRVGRSGTLTGKTVALLYCRCPVITRSLLPQALLTFHQLCLKTVLAVVKIMQESKLGQTLSELHHFQHSKVKNTAQSKSSLRHLCTWTETLIKIDLEINNKQQLNPKSFIRSFVSLLRGWCGGILSATPTHSFFFAYCIKQED